MMSCQICGDEQGPWEYERYMAEGCMRCIEKDINCKKCAENYYNYDYIDLNGKIVLVCENCANTIRKRQRIRRKQK